jgi:L-alanine-DL-glutamate epimerase-like enolase superfamily enzyme
VKIERIDVFQVDLPYAGGVYRLSGGRSYVSFDATVVRIRTDNDLEGWGESTPFGATYIAAHARGVRAGIAEIAPMLIGMDPRRVDRINDAMDAALAGHLHAKAPIDIACWDLFGKSVGLPVCELLGGRTELRLPVISSIHTGDPDDMRKRVDAYRNMGYRGHSVKIGGDPIANAARIEAALADRRPGEFFIVDANGGMSVEAALRMLRLLPPGLDFVLEAPCASWRECVSLRRRTDIPIFWDELATTESELVQIIAEDAADGIGLKLTKSGGLTRARRQRDMCIAAGYTLSVQDTTGSDIAFAAIVQLAQTVPAKLLRCALDCRSITKMRTASGNYAVIDGAVMAPPEAGLGITPLAEVFDRPVARYGA